MFHKAAFSSLFRSSLRLVSMTALLLGTFEALNMSAARANPTVILNQVHPISTHRSPQIIHVPTVGPVHSSSTPVIRQRVSIRRRHSPRLVNPLPFGHVQHPTFTHHRSPRPVFIRHRPQPTLNPSIPLNSSHPIVIQQVNVVRDGIPEAVDVRVLLPHDQPYNLYHTPGNIIQIGH